jgi:hypothetical protein
MKLTALLEETDPDKRLRRYALEMQERLSELPVDLDVQLGTAAASIMPGDNGKSIPVTYRDKHKLLRGFFTIGYTDRQGVIKFFASANSIGDLLYPHEGKEFNIDSLAKRLYKVLGLEFEAELENLLGKGSRAFKVNDEQLEDEFACWSVTTRRTEPSNIKEFEISVTYASDPHGAGVNREPIEPVVEETSLKAALEKIGLTVKAAK